MPGTLVLIGLYGPRISLGASGFRSHVSTWLGPPHSSTKMQHFFEETALPDSLNLSFPTTSPGTAKFRSPAPPAWRNRRREVLGRFIAVMRCGSACHEAAR